MRPVSIAELYNADELVYLLRVTWAGRVFRFASAATEIEEDDGEVYRYDGQLEAPDWVESMSLFSAESADSPTIPVEVTFPVDVALLVRRGHDLAAGRAEISVWVPGTDYDQRRTLLSGRVTEPEYGEEGEPCAFTISAAPWRDGPLWPDATAVIDTESCPGAPSQNIGKAYPQVYNQPGADRNSTIATAALGSVGWLIDTTGALSVANALLISDRECYPGQVRIYDLDTGNSSNRTLTTTTDARGRTITVVALDASGSGLTMDIGDGSHEYRVKWHLAGRGILNEKRNAPLRGAGEILMDVLQGAADSIDLGRWRSVQAALDAYELSGAIEERVRPWAWFLDNLAPLLPLRLQAGPSGVYPIHWMAAPSARHHRFDLTIPRDGERVGRVGYHDDQIVNAFSLGYQLSRKSDTYQKTKTLDETASLFCALSESRYGRREMDPPLESDWICEDATASAILRDLSRKHALPVQRVTYALPTRLAYLEVGMWGRLTDASLHWDAQPVLCTGVRPRPQNFMVELAIPEDPVRDELSA